MLYHEHTTSGGGADRNSPAEIFTEESRVNEHASTSLHQARNEILDQYFSILEGAQPNRVHEMVMSAVEMPLFEYIMQRCEGNQSAASAILGINRNTLRKKLRLYGLL